MSVNAPGLKSWVIGDFRVTVIMELDTLVIPPAAMLRTDAEYQGSKMLTHPRLEEISTI